MRIGHVDVKQAARDLFQAFKDDEVTGMGAQSAYGWIFALPPMLIFFTALSGAVNRYTGVDVFGQVLTLAQRGLPAPVYQTVSLVIDGVRNRGTSGFLSFGFVVALWSASNALDSVIQGANRAYNVVEHRSYVRRRGLEILLTAGLSLLVIGAFVLFVFGRRLGLEIAEAVGLGSTFTAVWNIVRWPAVVILIMVALAILYWVGPAIKLKFNWVSPGAVLATVLWLVATFGFSIYLGFSNPGSAYGVLGTLVVLLFYLYVMGIILLVGAELNAVLDLNYAPEVIREKVAYPERQTDPVAAQQRALALAAREGLSPAEVGVTPEAVSRVAEQVLSSEPAPAPPEEPAPKVGRGALVAVLVSMGSLFVAALFGALDRVVRGRGPGRA